MPISVARHRRFVWLEYQDSEDGVAFHATFSDAAMGWRSLFEQLRAAGPLRVDDEHPEIDIRYVPSRSTPGMGSGLIAFPPMGKGTGAETEQFLEKWINSPGINAGASKLTFGTDATDWADVVVVSGHGSSGTVFGDGSAKGKFSMLLVKRAFETYRNLARGEYPKYLILPCCFLCSDELGAEWLPAFSRTPLVSGVRRGGVISFGT